MLSHPLCTGEKRRAVIHPLHLCEKTQAQACVFFPSWDKPPQEYAVVFLRGVVSLHISEPSYQSDTHTAVMRGCEITVENLTPIFGENELREQQKEIEEALYDIFAKYQKTE